MPKNNKRQVVTFDRPYCECPCGWSKTTERYCDLNRVLNRHMKCCKLAQSLTEIKTITTYGINEKL